MLLLAATIFLLIPLPRSAFLSQKLDQMELRLSNIARSLDTERYLIHPVNDTDKEAFLKTEGNLKTIMQMNNIFSYTESKKTLSFWFVKATSSQLTTRLGTMLMFC